MRQLPLCILLLFLPGRAFAKNYDFNGSMPEDVLRSYLSRSITMVHLLTEKGGDFNDNLRMLGNIDAKFAGRAIYCWGRESQLPGLLKQAAESAKRIHAADPQMILQACLFEIVTTEVSQLTVPPRAFKALGLPVEKRNFRYEDMLDPGGKFHDHWRKGSSVPDVSRAETKLWFYSIATAYIDVGCEALHIGQMELMDMNDPDLAHWEEIIASIRKYAARYARRHFVVCDAHVPSGGLVRNGKLLLDFHSFPLRIEEAGSNPLHGALRMGFVDGIYGRSKGGITPSGWPTDHLPCLVEFDNYGASEKPGVGGQGHFWVWGWDEITWFAQLPEAARNAWLWYAWKWVRESDPNAYLEMPGSRNLSASPNKRRWYFANRQSKATPLGSGQEDTIRQIWAQDTEGKNTEPDGHE